jgi:hypothetical protein
MRSLVVACGALFFVLVGIYLSEKKHARELAKMGAIQQKEFIATGKRIVGPPTPIHLQEKILEDLKKSAPLDDVTPNSGIENSRDISSVPDNKDLNLKKIYGKSLEDKAEIKWDVQLREYQASLSKMLLNSSSDLNEVAFLQAEIVRLKLKLGHQTSNLEKWTPALLMYLVHEEKYKPDEINKAKNHEYFGYSKTDWEKLKKQQSGQVEQVAKKWKASGPKGKWVDEENSEEVSDEFAANDYKVYKLED